MTQITKLGTATTVRPEHREVVSQQLEATLVELIALGLMAKQAHWNVTGPRFLGLHEHLDGLVDLARGFADTIAERSTAIGVPPSGQAEAVAANNQLPPLDEGWLRDDAVLTALIERVSVIAGRVRERVAQLGEFDPVSEDLLIGVVGALEKQAWMLEASR